MLKLLVKNSDLQLQIYQEIPQFFILFHIYLKYSLLKYIKTAQRT